jgi:hypothetical protein
MELAGGIGMPWAMRTAVYIHGAGSANTFPAIMIKSDRIFSFPYQFLVQNIKHLEKGHFRRNIFNLVGFKSPDILMILLAPDFECEVHVIMFHSTNVGMRKCGNVKIDLL